MTDLDDSTEISSLRHAAALAKIDVPAFVLPVDANAALRGLRFHYLDWGTAGKPPILFLHGGGLNAHTFDLVCLSLRQEYHCVSFDQRGHGDSDWSPVMDYSIATEAEDIIAVVQHLGWDRFVLVGMSMGGLNALKYAGTHSSRLHALVLIDTGPEFQSAGARRIDAFRAESLDTDSIEDYVARAVEFNPLRDPVILRRSLIHNLRRTPDGKLTWKWDPRPRFNTPSDTKAVTERLVELWKDVDHVDCPTLVVRGEQSDVFSAENAAKLTSHLKYGQSVVVERAGHTVQGDNPSALVREMRRFLETLNG